MPKSKADVWLSLYENSLSNRAYAGRIAEDDIADAAIDADMAYMEFDARFYAVSGGGFGPRPPKKVEGDPAPTITMPPTDQS